MPYLISLCIVVGAVVVLGVLLIRLATPARRLTGTAHLCGAYLSDRIGLLKARIAGLKVELARRRRPRHTANPGGPSAA